MSGADRFAIDLEDCADDLRRYLADGIPPLLAADPVAALVRHAPQAISGQIQAWLSFHHQARRGTVSAADLAFHALRKLHLLGDLGLVPKGDLGRYLPELVEALVPLCPPEDRELVRGALERLRQAPGEAIDSSFRVGGATDPLGRRSAAGPETPPEVARELRRFALLLARLKSAGGAAGAGDELAASLVAAAASSARDAAELREYLEHLQEQGVAAGDPAAVVRALSRTVPAWAPATPSPEALGGNARALHRYVDLAEAPRQRLDRFRELVAAVVEAFNAGSLPRAVALVQVASRLLAEGRIPPSEAELVCGRAHEALDAERLRVLAVDPHQQPLLRQLMTLFPGLQPAGLLTDLDGEPDRGRRRLLMTLLEVHGGAARPELLDRIEASFEDTRDTAWFWQRNLCYLLHRLPCPPDALEERELAAAIAFSDLRHHPRLVGEAAIRLGQIDHPRAEAALRERLLEVEAMLAAKDPTGPPPEDLERLSALLATQLLRSASPTARRGVAEAALRRLRESGDPGRVAALRGVDLSDHPDLVDDLLRALHDSLPRKVLGMTLQRHDEAAAAVVEALAATDTPAVRRALEEVAARHPRERPGIEAARTLATLGTARPAAPAATAPAPPPAAAGQRMEGDLQLFGLPNLLQSLAQSGLSGTLTLRDERGEAVAVLELEAGGLTGCAAGRLSGETAFYQLLVRPAGSSFAFAARDAGPRPAAGHAAGGGGAAGGGNLRRDLLGLLMEGMRRLDEYERARALVPDDAVLVPTGARPTAAPGETDGAFVRDLWGRVKSGAGAAACEAAVAADAYRVRTLLAHWLAEGAVTLAPAGPPAAPG